jgi:hypothetical protein
MRMEHGRPARQKKKWSDFSPAQQRAIILGALAELFLTALALRDLAHRRSGQVRGGKFLWLCAFVVQPFGPILYFLVGRRGAVTAS